MDKKILALIITLVLIVGVYGAFYAAVTTILVPQDLVEFQNQLNDVSVYPMFNESDITMTETGADVTEKSQALKYLSQAERTSMANDMRNNYALPLEYNQTFAQYYDYNMNKARIYALIFRGDISNAINNVTNIYVDISRLESESTALSQKMATDMENANDKAYAQDLRDMAVFMRKYNAKMAELKTQLQQVVNQLGG